MRISQPGLDYAASVAVDIMSARVLQFPIPDEHDIAVVKVGQVTYDITNITVSNALKLHRLLSLWVILPNDIDYYYIGPFYINVLKSDNNLSLSFISDVAAFSH